MPHTIRQRILQAAGIGEIGAGFAVAAQYFIGMPVGHQPEWLGTVASVAIVPAQYILVPFADPLKRLMGSAVGDGVLFESVTPFGPAMRFEMGHLALLALATLIIVGLVDYLAQGVVELYQAHKPKLRPSFS
jgi:hypothetical protein